MPSALRGRRAWWRGRGSQIQSGQLKEAADTLDAARTAGLDDARVAVLRAQLLLDVKGAAGRG